MPLVGTTRGLGAVLELVTVVQTIIVPVTHPGLGDAALVVAGEVPGVGAGLDRGLGAGVTITGPTVRGELVAVGTAAHGHHPGAILAGYGEAELAAAPVVHMARVVAGNELGLLAENLDAVQPVGLLHLLHNDLVAPAELVHSDDGIQAPVGDKQVFFEDNKRERMSNEAGLYCLHISAIQVGMLQTKDSLDFLASCRLHVCLTICELIVTN